MTKKIGVTSIFHNNTTPELQRPLHHEGLDPKGAKTHFPPTVEREVRTLINETTSLCCTLCKYLDY